MRLVLAYPRFLPSKILCKSCLKAVLKALEDSGACDYEKNNESDPVLFKTTWKIYNPKTKKDLVRYEQVAEPITEVKFGNIVAFEGHVGIYLGENIYISATHPSPFPNKVETNNVSIDYSTKEDRIIKE